VRHKGPTYFQAGLLTLAVVVVGTYFAFTKSIPFQGHYTVKAAFKSANNIRPNSHVRIAGVTVGKVTSVEHLGGGEEAAIVEMRIDDKGLPIHTDATAQIRPRIFLEGNFFVDLHPGSPSAPVIDDGGTLPINQTAAPVQIDQVLTSLQTDTRKDLQKLLRELGRGLSGRGVRGFNASMKYWEPAYRDGAIVNRASLGEQPTDLGDYVRDAGIAAAGIDRDPAALRELITTFNTTAAAFAREDDDLADAIAELPRTLAAARPALAALNSSFPPLRRFIRDFRPAVRSSGPALDASLPFAKELRGLVKASELRGLVKDLRAAVPSLAALTRASVPLQNQVGLASSCQNEVILPWTKDSIQDPTFPATGKVFEEATKPIPGLAGESRSGDANGQWFRVLLGYGNFASSLGTDDIFLTNSPLIGTNPPKPAKRTPMRSDVPCETQQRPDLRTRIGDPPSSHKITIPASKKAAYNKIVKRAVKSINKRIARSGLKGELKAITKPATLDTLKKVRQAAARAKQVNR
jgi:virulence factor Mce-like protein